MAISVLQESFPSSEHLNWIKANYGYILLVKALHRIVHHILEHSMLELIHICTSVYGCKSCCELEHRLCKNCVSNRFLIRNKQQSVLITYRNMCRDKARVDIGHNTNWTIDSVWEFAKLFLPNSYQNCTCLDDLDAGGMLGVYIT